MFLQVSVCPQGGKGCLPQCMLGCHPPPDQADLPRTRQTPQTRQNPPDQADPPDQAEPPLGPGRPPRTRQTPSPRTRQTPPGPGRPPPDQVDTPPDQVDTPRTRQTPPPGSRLQHTVYYERPVRILLECILVLRKKCFLAVNCTHEILTNTSFSLYAFYENSNSPNVLCIFERQFLQRYQTSAAVFPLDVLGIVLRSD